MALNDFQIGLIAGLDETKSKQQLSQDIEVLKNQLGEIKIQAKLDDKTIADLTKQLNSAQINLQNVSVSQTAIAKMVSQINSALSGININIGNNLNSDGIVQNAQRTGQQIGQVISNEAQKAIGNVTSNNIGKYFRISPSTSNQFKSEMEKLVSGWTNGKGKLTDIKIDTRTSYDKDSQQNIERLHQATVTYKNDLDEVIKKTIAWRQIATSIDEKGNETPIRGFIEVAGQYSKSLDVINQKVDTFVEKQKTAVAKAQNILNSIQSDLTDKGATRTLANTNFDKNGLTDAISKVDNAIKALGSSTKATFIDANNEVAKSISELNDLITRLKNAEYTATSLRTKDISTIKTDEINKLDTFVEKMKQSGHYTDELKADVTTLKNSLNLIFDANSLTNYLNEMSNLESKFKLVDAQAKTLEKDTKLQTNIESEKKQLQVYTNELKQAGVMSGEVKDKIQQMFYSLSKVDTQTGLTTWRAELKGVKAETDEVLKSVQKLSATSIPQAKYTKIFNGGYEVELDKLASEFQKINAYSDPTQKKINSLRQALANMQTMSGSELVSTFNNFETEVGKVKIQLDQAKLSFDKFAQPVSAEKITSLLLRIQNFMSKNTAITKEAKTQLELYITTLKSGNVTLGQWNEINQGLATTESHMRVLGKLGMAFKDQWRQAVSSFGTWLSASTVVMKVISSTKDAVTELKDINTYLTEISKSNDKLSENELAQIGSDSFNTASKYGKKATDYLSGVQEASRAGYENAEAIAEISTAAQGAGDMTADLANSYIIATDKAYDMNGSIKELTRTLDGANNITNHNAVNMSELAEGMKVVGSQAASSQMSVEETTAAIGTLVAVTQQGGSEMGNAFKGILMNLRQVTGEVDDGGDAIDEESLTKYEKACENLGVSLTTVKDGVVSLKEPMQILKELSEEYTKLDESDAKRANLLTAVGGKYRANALNAILENYSTYEKMLQDYADGEGSMAEEAEKTANSWEGSLNRLQNTFNSTVGNIVNSDAVIKGINTLNSLLSMIDKLTASLGSWKTLGLGAGLFAGIKNVGRDKMYSLSF